MQSYSPRCLQLFEASIRSPKTLRLYGDYLDKFLAWAHKDHESILLLPSDQIQLLFEDYIFHLRKRGVGFSTITVNVSAISKFLLINDKEIKSRKIRMLMPERKKTEGKHAYTNEQIRKMLEFADTLRSKAIIHCLSAGGFRDGVFEEMKWKHISEMPDNCYCVTVYPNSMHEYVTFLHHEARKALDEYTEERRAKGELVTPESYVLVANKKNATDQDKPMTSQNIGSVLQRIVGKAKIMRVRSESGKRFDISVGNGFRKRFNTILKSNPNISFAIAERMMDHKTYLEHIYLDTSDKNKFFEEYKKAIPDLILSEGERQKIEIVKQNKIAEDLKKVELEKDIRISKLESKLEQIGRLLEQFQVHQTST